MNLPLLILLSAVAASPGDATSKFWTTPNQCAAWAAVQAARLMGREFAIDDVDRLLPSDGRPKSLLEVKKALESVGVSSFGSRFSKSELPDEPRPMILPIRVGDRETLHFIVVVGWDQGRALYLDGPRDPQWTPRSRLKIVWTGEALVLGDPPSGNYWLSAAGLGLAIVGACVAARRRNAATEAAR